MADEDLIHAIREAAHPLTGAPGDYDDLLDWVGGARLVLIGEGSHGSHEFYRERALITRRLIERKGFTAVAVEADWPDAWRINRYVRGDREIAADMDALSGFERFPTWMWRNIEVLDFLNWLRDRNGGRGEDQAGFYGLDLYSMYTSIGAVVRYLDQVDPDAATRARFRYSCFEDFGEDSQAYGYAAGFGLEESCEKEAVRQLVEMRERAIELARRDGRMAEDEFFAAEQNARLVKNAEEYYRSMFHGRLNSWNLRDRHMVETLEALLAHLDRRGSRTKAVLWAHNSHLGDARATGMGRQGEWNVGQLVRERFGNDAVLIGQTTYDGAVMAASQWDGPAMVKRVRPALPESYEALFHRVGFPQFALRITGGPLADALREERLERAIGVIYRPETERISHYFDARLAEQFDIVLHFDRTTALEPLDRAAPLAREEEWETFPSGV